MCRAMAGIVTKETLFTLFQKLLVITVDAVLTDSEKILDINLTACTLVNKVTGNEPEGVYIIFGMLCRQYDYVKRIILTILISNKYISL